MAATAGGVAIGSAVGHTVGHALTGINSLCDLRGVLRRELQECLVEGLVSQRQHRRQCLLSKAVTALNPQVLVLGKSSSSCSARKHNQISHCVKDSMKQFSNAKLETVS
jgi:hypothetical protein